MKDIIVIIILTLIFAFIAVEVIKDSPEKEYKEQGRQPRITIPN